MIDDTELSERVAVALRAKAAEVTTLRRGFDPDRGSRLSSEEPLGMLEHRSGRRRWRMLAVAATVVVVATAGGVLVSRSGDDPEPTETGPATETGPGGGEGDPASAGPPDGALAPGWVPDDLQLWDVSWHQGPSFGWFDGKAQMFSTSEDGDARVLVEITSQEDYVWGDEPVTVRGQGGRGYSGGGKDAVAWNEGDVSVSAFFTGISRDDTVAFLDSLAWRSGDRMEGFEAPEGATLSVVGETAGPPDAGQVVTTSFTYGYDVPTISLAHDDELSIYASIPIGDAAGTVTRDYLEAWFHDNLDEGGVTTSSELLGETPDGSTMASLEAALSDGTDLFILARYDGVSEADLQKIADSISQVSGDELDDLRRSVSNVYAAEPVVASAELPSATLTVRGQEGFHALCIEVGEADISCSATAPAVTDATPRRMTSVQVDGEWYVAAASPEEPPLVTEGAVSHEDFSDTMADLLDDVDPEELARALANSQGGAPEELEIESETAVDGEWHFAVAVPPADVDEVTVWFGTRFGVLSRSGSP